MFEYCLQVELMCAVKFICRICTSSCWSAHLSAADSILAWEWYDTPCILIFGHYYFYELFIGYVELTPGSTEEAFWRLVGFRKYNTLCILWEKNYLYLFYFSLGWILHGQLACRLSRLMWSFSLFPHCFWSHGTLWKCYCLYFAISIYDFFLLIF